jgi:hypothetical protein
MYACVFALTVLLTLNALAQETMRAGAARESIVPSFSSRLGGFSDRSENFAGVDTPIFARALVCSNGDTTLVVVTTDLLCVTRNLVKAVRADAAAKTGIPAENILVTAAHNHSAPSGFQEVSLFGAPHDPKLLKFLTKTLVKTIVKAADNQAPVEVGFAYGSLEGATSNRQQHNDTAVDPQVGVLKLQKAGSRELVATLFNFTGHPVILGGDNLQISGEYPGIAQQTVEEVLGGVALFTQGACGDVTMKRGGPPFEEVKRVGRTLGAEVIKTTGLIRYPQADATLVSVFQRVQLESRRQMSRGKVEILRKVVLDELEKLEADPNAEPEKLKYERERAYYATWSLRMSTFKEEHPEAYAAMADASVHVMQIGPLVIVGIPGELFVEYALEMKRRIRQATGRPAIVAGFANDYIGYIVSPDTTGGYELATRFVSKNAGRALTDAALDTVRSHVVSAKD